MECKKCKTLLEDGVTVCPECGTEQTEPVEETVAETAPEAPAAEQAQTPDTAEAAQEPKASGRMALTVAAMVLLLGVLVALIIGGRSAAAPENETETASGSSSNIAITDPTELTEPTQPTTVPADTLLDDVTYRGSYVVSDEEMKANADVVVATVGDRVLTNSELQVYYGMMINQFMSNEFYYLYYNFGYYLDFTQPLDTYPCLYDENLTWHQYFLRQALDAWHSYNSLALQAEADGYELSQENQEFLAGIADELEAEAVKAGYENAQAYVEYYLGTGATLEGYLSFMNAYYMGYNYYIDLTDDIHPTDEEIEAYFLEHEAEYAENGLTQETKTVNVRHILVLPQGATVETIRTETFSEEAWAWAETQAQQVLDEWLAGETTEERFAELANTHSADAHDTDGDGVKDDGGLYTDVTQGYMVENFDAWCFDAARQIGDYGIVKTEFGYHIMYFAGSNLLWRQYAEEDLVTEQCNAVIEQAGETYPMDVDYSLIRIGYVDMGM